YRHASATPDHHTLALHDALPILLSPERKAPKKEREYAAARLDGVINKIKNVMQTALAKIQRTLMQPEVKQAGKEQVKKKAKESIDRKSTRLNSSHVSISYAVFCF